MGATTLSSQDRRAGKRKDVAFPSRLRHGEFLRAEVRIVNLSVYGFRASCDLPLEKGAYVSVDLPNIGLVRARVAWSQDGRVGAMFTKPVDVRRCLLSSQV